MGQAPIKKGTLFRQRIFSRLFVGSVASSIGSSAGTIAITWLVYTVTLSAFDVALVGIVGIIPRIAFGIFSGALADRYGRLNIMIIADTIRALTMIVFATTLLFYGFNLWIVLSAVFVLGLGQSLFRPSIQSFLPTIVPRESLGTANGLFISAQEAMSIIGSPLGGTLIGIIGVAGTLYFNGASYITSGLFIIVVSLSLSSMGLKNPQLQGNERRESFFEQVKGGFRYMNQERGLLKLTIASFGANFFLVMFFTFLVVYVSSTLGAGSFVFGVVSAAGGAGFAVGSLLAGKSKLERKFGIWFSLPWGMAAFGILGLVLFPTVDYATIFVFLLSLGGGFGNTIWFTGVQKFVPNEILGRFLGMDEVGSIAAGPAGQVFGGLIIPIVGLGVDYALAAAGVAILCFGLLLFPDVRALKVSI